MPNTGISISREHWLAILASVGPCRVAGPSAPAFIEAVNASACKVADEGEIDLYVAVDSLPEAALGAALIVYVSTTPKSAALADGVLLRGLFRRSVDDTEIGDRFGGPLRVRKYERDPGRYSYGESRRAGRLASEAIRRHLAIARQIKFGDLVLDIAGGCGFRSLVLAAMAPAASVICLLPGRRAAEAEVRFGPSERDRLTFDDLDALSGSLVRGRFDCIVCRHRQIRQEILDAVAPGGRLIVLGRTEGPLPGFRRDTDPLVGLESWMRCPLAASDLPVEDRYFLSGRASTPRSLAPGRMHENPGVARAMVTEPTRLRSAHALAELAIDVAEVSSVGSKDHLSALVVLGHRLLDGMDVVDEGVWFRMTAAARAAAGTDAPYLRWKVSLDFVEASLHEARGRMEAACALYYRVATVDATEYHPSLLTKTAEAAIRAARIEMAAGDIEAARRLLRRAASTSRETLRADPSLITGEDGALTDFYMLEAAATLQMAAYAAMALNLDRRSGVDALRRHLARSPMPRSIFTAPDAVLPPVWPEGRVRRLWGRIEPRVGRALRFPRIRRLRAGFGLLFLQRFGRWPASR